MTVMGRAPGVTRLDPPGFPCGVGNTQQDPARFASLIDDVEERIFAVLPDDTWVYPGHGKDTTLGAERPHLGEWRERGW
jgi:glyoxylase-like metal-dependent hydrolase (beta-lactamase superfamily II)